MTKEIRMTNDEMEGRDVPEIGTPAMVGLWR
jgi:hypothetical protein